MILDTAPFHEETSSPKRSSMARVVERFHSFTQAFIRKQNELRCLSSRSWFSFYQFWRDRRLSWPIGTKTASTQCVPDVYVTYIAVVKCSNRHASLGNINVYAADPHLLCQKVRRPRFELTACWVVQTKLTTTHYRIFPAAGTDINNWVTKWNMYVKKSNHFTKITGPSNTQSGWDIFLQSRSAHSVPFNVGYSWWLGGSVVSVAVCGPRGREFDAQPLCSSCPVRCDGLSS